MREDPPEFLLQSLQVSLAQSDHPSCSAKASCQGSPYDVGRMGKPGLCKYLIVEDPKAGKRGHPQETLEQSSEECAGVSHIV